MALKIFNGHLCPHCEGNDYRPDPPENDAQTKVCMGCGHVRIIWIESHSPMHHDEVVQAVKERNAKVGKS